jgi:hypothetical protein
VFIREEIGSARKFKIIFISEGRMMLIDRKKMYLGLMVVLMLFATVDASLIAHWALDEVETAATGDIWTVAESTGNCPSASVWGWVDLGAEAGPAGGSDVAAYFHNNGIATNVPSIIPSSSDFTILVQVRTGAYAGYKHLFSSYNANNGSALMLQDGVLKFYTASTGTISSGVNVGDWVYHEVGISRSGDNFSFIIDGTVAATISSPGAIIGATDNLLIGADRLKNNDFVGYIADVKVYNNAIPEPTTLILLSIGFLSLCKKKER